MLLRQHGLALASELADLVESADGDVEDSSIATPMAVATWATHGCFNGTPIVEAITYVSRETHPPFERP